MYPILTRKSSIFFFLKTTTFTLLTLCLTSVLLAQGVDPNFDPAPGVRGLGGSLDYANPRVKLQPDGKILLYGDFTFNNVAGNSRNGIARLNADGTFDNTFNFENNVFSSIGSAVVLPNGKIVIGGIVGNYTNPQVIQLNANGTRDLTFTTNFQPLSNVSDTKVWGTTADGKVYASLRDQNVGLTTLFRLNADGTFDNAFTAIDFDINQGDYLLALKVLADGKIMIAGSRQGFGKIFRITHDGLLDKGFTSPTMTSDNNAPPLVYSFGFQSTGKIVIFGNFLSVNSTSRIRYARLNADGSNDPSFTDGIVPIPYTDIEVLSDDTILASSVAKFTAEGAVDNSFTGIPGTSYFAVDNSDRIIASQTISLNPSIPQIARFNSSGIEDNSFTRALVGRQARIRVVASQPDGKVLVAGFFSFIEGVLRSDLARLNNDGTVDSGFNQNLNTQSTIINKITVQNDGKILIGGNLNFNGSSNTYGVIRLNADGSLDTSFAIPAIPNTIFDFEFQTDGKLVAVGQFDLTGGCRNVIRTNTDGSRDTTFQCVTMTSNQLVRDVIILPDGKILIGGAIPGGINGINRVNLARLNSDGSLDSTFNAMLDQFNYVEKIHRENNGKIVVATKSSVKRVTADGATDPTFNELSIINSKTILAEPDGTYIIGGQSNFIRISNNGSVDPSFLPAGVNGIVNSIARQTDGQIIVGGEYTRLGDIARSSVARYNPPAFQNTVDYDFDGDGKADIAVFRPSENRWYVLRSSDFGVTQQVFAINGDSPVASDFDGDGKTDFAIYRNSQGDFWSLSSASGSQLFAHLGQNGDIPRPSDFDGDGRSDYIVYRPSNFTWYRVSSGTGQISHKLFGTVGDKPIVGDFDGDGKTDVAIYRPATGEWWWQSSVDNVQRATRWGISTDIPTPGDYDGDGKTDFAVYRPSTGIWYILNSSTLEATIIRFGLDEDKPVPADYDGDGKTDIGLYRPSTGVWYLLRSTEGFTAYSFGISTDIPVPNAFIP